MPVRSLDVELNLGGAGPVVITTSGPYGLRRNVITDPVICDALRGKNICRDENGEFASCGTASGPAKEETAAVNPRHADREKEDKDRTENRASDDKDRQDERDKEDADRLAEREKEDKEDGPPDADRLNERAEEDSDRAAERAQEDADTAEERADEDVATAREREDEDTGDARDVEDAELTEYRDAEDEAVSERDEDRNKEDAALQSARDFEDSSIAEEREEEDKERGEKQAAEAEKMEADHAAEDAALDEKWAEEDADLEDKHANGELSDSQHAQAVKEKDDRQVDEGNARYERQEAAKAEMEARHESENEAVDGRREKEDEATEKTRAKEDKEIKKRRGEEDAEVAKREGDRQKEDAALAKERDKEDAATQKARDKEDAALAKARAKKALENLDVRYHVCAAGHVHVRVSGEFGTQDYTFADEAVEAWVKEVCRDADGKFAPCGGESGGSDAAGKGPTQADLDDHVEALRETPEGRAAIAKGRTIAGKIKDAIVAAVHSALSSVDEATAGGISLLGHGFRTGSPVAIAAGVNHMASAVFQCVHEEVFEAAMSAHSIPGAHAVGNAAATLAAHAENAVLKTVAWAWGSKKKSAAAYVKGKGKALTPGDKKLLNTMAKIARDNLKAVFDQAGYDGDLPALSALKKSILDKLRAR